MERNEARPRRRVQPARPDGGGVRWRLDVAGDDGIGWHERDNGNDGCRNR